MLSKFGLKASIWVIRLASKLITEVGYRLWCGGSTSHELGNKVTRCATRLRIRAYEMERRIR